MRYFCFSQLCKKEVICIDNGKKLGYVSDIRFDAKKGEVCDLLVPSKNSLSLFGSKDCLRVHWCDVERIGEDVIWVCGCYGRNDNHDRDYTKDDCCC